MIALAVLAWLLRTTPGYPFVFALALTAFVFAFAYTSPSLGCLRFGDYSYGLYLWGFPIQQVVAQLAPQLTPADIVLIAWPLAMVLAVLSWHLVEHPALRMKLLPGAIEALGRQLFWRARAGVVHSHRSLNHSALFDRPSSAARSGLGGGEAIENSDNAGSGVLRHGSRVALRFVACECEKSAADSRGFPGTQCFAGS